MKSDMMYDYMKIIDKTPPPGAEGVNQGNGNASQYLDTSTPQVPVDSKLSNEEQKVLQEANQKKTEKAGVTELSVKDADQKSPPKQKPGFLNAYLEARINNPALDFLYSMYLAENLALPASFKIDICPIPYWIWLDFKTILISLFKH